jgi:ABC-2 type transport system ATP-binding protein
MNIIELQDITKEFKVYKRQEGFLSGIKSLFHRPYETRKAVDSISFDIKKGETVGYIGANGAGKSTTLKILAGILVPTSGNVWVNGEIPYKNRRKNAKSIGLVFGQRSKLHWDLPVMDTFNLYKKIYDIDSLRFKRNYDFFVELLQMEDFINKPVRQLSLGQKMRAELATALLHDPEILYLDEPTIGLDIIAKTRIRHFIREINREKKTTVILTTHDMDDIEEICEKIIMIDKGKVIYNGSLEAFKNDFGEDHMLIVDFEDEEYKNLDLRFRVIKEQGIQKHIIFNKQEISVANAITSITRNYSIKDLKLKEPGIEDIIKKLYA